MTVITVIAAVITIIGALNWLLVGAFSFDIIAAIFGAATTVSNILYIIVGIAGLWLLYYLIAMALRPERREETHYNNRDFHSSRG